MGEVLVARIKRALLNYMRMVRSGLLDLSGKPSTLPYVSGGDCQ